MAGIGADSLERLSSQSNGSGMLAQAIIFEQRHEAWPVENGLPSMTRAVAAGERVAA